MNPRRNLIHPFEPACRYCGGRVMSDTGNNMNLPEWARGRHFFRCENYPQCDTWVACFPNYPDRPMGWAANPQTRLARATLVKRFIDPIWMWKNAMRVENDTTDYKTTTYAWLAEKLGRSSIQIGMLDISECLKLKDFCMHVHKKYPALVSCRNQIEEQLKRINQAQ